MAKRLLVAIIFTFFINFAFAQEKQSADHTAIEQHFVNQAVAIDKDVSFYPNPVEDFLTIKVSEKKLENVEFELYNIIGNSLDIEVEKLENFNYRINLKGFNSGYYLLVIKDDINRYNKAFKFQKE